MAKVGSAKYMTNKFVEIHKKWGKNGKHDLTKINQGMLAIVENAPKYRKKASKEFLEILMNVGIEEEQYEVCSLIKKELEKRKNDTSK